MSEAEFLQSFPHRFRDRSLARAALHLRYQAAARSKPSVTARARSAANRAQFLKFLGDRTLRLAVADLLRAHWTNRTLGEIDRAYSRLVSEALLLEIAIEMGLPGSKDSSARFRRLPDTVEALLGAVFADAGFDAAKDCTVALYGQRIADPDASLWVRNAKTELQELCSRRGLKQPEYAIEAKEPKRVLVRCSAAGVSAVAEGKVLAEARMRVSMQVLAQLAKQAE